MSPGPLPLVGMVGIRPVSPPGPRVAFHLWGDAVLTGGVGGWESVPRPKRRAGLEWVSEPPYQLVFTVVLTGVDAFGPNRDAVIDGQVGTLRSWGKPTAATGQPPLLQVDGPVDLPAPWTLWGLGDLAVADTPATLRDGAGRLLQQALTLTLLEWTPAEVQLGPAAAARR